VSWITENAGRSAYGASKWGVAGLSRLLAIDLAAFGTRVNVLAPDAVKHGVLPDDEAKQSTAPTPLRRYACPEEIAGGVVFLCFGDASFVAGHVLVVDCGFSAAGLTVAPSSDD